jgi:hypothetical protein
MTLDSKEVVRQIDQVLGKMEPLLPHLSASGMPSDIYQVLFDVVSLASYTIERLSPVGSDWRVQADTAMGKQGVLSPLNVMRPLVAILKGMKFAYENGDLADVSEMVHADVFGDFLEMGRYLLDEKFKDAAAVMVGGVLEEHLRKLCVKNSIPIEVPGPGGKMRPKMIDGMNTELRQKGVYSKTDQLQVTAWGAIRNAAAHADYDDYSMDQVRVMLDGVTGFVSRFPA